MGKTVHRRRLVGAPLLIAGAGTLVVMAACNGTKPEPVVGNLAPPQEVLVCVTPTPTNAQVLINEQPTDAGADGKHCRQVFIGNAQIKVIADGYAPHVEDLQAFEPVTRSVQLQPALPEVPPEPPVGNLAPPPDIK